MMLALSSLSSTTRTEGRVSLIALTLEGEAEHGKCNCPAAEVKLFSFLLSAPSLQLQLSGIQPTSPEPRATTQLKNCIGTSCQLGEH